jgi:hypothetical protein
MEKTIYITNEQLSLLREYRKKKHKKVSAMDQVGNKVNSGLMIAITGGGVCESLDKGFDFKKYFNEIGDYMENNGLHVKPFPSVELNRDEQDGLFIKTGHYEPENKKVVLFVFDRHPKDILRSFAHEMVHHAQNLRGEDLGFSGDDDVKDNKRLEKLESEAYLKGNIFFRKWTEVAKKKSLNESVDSKEEKIIRSTVDAMIESGELPKDYNGHSVEMAEHYSKIFKKAIGKEYNEIPFDDSFVLSAIVDDEFRKKGGKSDLDGVKNHEDSVKKGLSQIMNEAKSDSYVLYADTMKCHNSDFMADFEDGIKEKSIKKLLEFLPEESVIENGKSEKISDIEKKGTIELEKEGLLFVRQKNNEHDWFVYKKKSKSLNEEIEEKIEPGEVSLKSFTIQKHLNPKFWKDGHLDSRVRMKLLDIADDFIKYMGIDWVEPKDIVMTGSLANYNWHEKYSDIDLHIIMDYSEIADNETIVDNYLYSQKELWNKDHEDISIYGFPVECFVENSESNDGVESGVYSLEKDKWIEKPNREHLSTYKVNKGEIRKKIAWYINKVDELEFLYTEADDEFKKRKVYKRACALWDKIKAERTNGFENSDNEMNQGNIVFKALRRRDCIERITKIKAKLYDSLKSLNEGRKKIIKNDEGEIVPEKCTECGADIGIYIQGEPVYKCTKCGKFYGTMPCTLYHSPKKKKKNSK